jgi:hypothetical protein
LLLLVWSGDDEAFQWKVEPMLVMSQMMLLFGLDTANSTLLLVLLGLALCLGETVGWLASLNLLIRVHIKIKDDDESDTLSVFRL